MKPSRLPLVLLVLLGLGTAGCDLATKQWAVRALSAPNTTARGVCERDARTQRFVPTRLDTSRVVLAPDALELVYTENCAGAFGLMYGQRAPLRRAVLMLGSLAAAIALVVFARQNGARHPWVARAGVAVVLGGAVGNFVDRVGRGFVVDFIHAHWRAYEYPVFNVADIAVAVGVGLLLIASAPGAASARSGAA